MDKFNGWRDQGNKEEWYMRASNSSTWKEGNLCKMDVQDEEWCKKDSQEGIEYDEVFAPIAQLETIYLLISLAAQNKWRIYQMDLKSSFLNV